MVEIWDRIQKCSRLEKAIFYQISSNGPLAKSDLLKKLDLKHATLARAVDSLIEKQLLVQIMAAESATLGRKPKQLAVNPAAFYLIGIDISRHSLKTTLRDARLLEVGYSEADLGGIAPPEFIMDTIKSTVNQLLTKHAIDQKSVLGLGIGVVGKLNKSGGIIEYVDNFGVDWKDVAIRDRLQREIGIPVFLENGANAAVFAEFMMGSARGFQDILFANIGVGLRCGTIHDGRVIQNINKIDSTYGHIVIEPSGRKCSCGNYGCLVMYCTIGAIVEDYITMAKRQHSHIPTEILDTITVRDIADFHQNGDMIATQALTHAAVYFGIGLANIVSILNPEIVVLGGPIIECSDLYFTKAIEVARSKIYKLEERNISFTKSHCESAAVLSGMCALMIEKAFN